MNLALQQYKVLKQTGEWTAKSEEDKKILALSATVSKLQQQLKDETKSNESTERQQNKRNYVWKNKPPKGNQKKVKEVNGKTYHWCPYHGKEGKWCLHKPTECCLKPNQGQTPPSQQQQQQQQTPNNASQQIMNAILNTLMNKSQDE